jgi:hypothetical protein
MLNRRGHDPQRREERRMAVTRDHLCRDGLGLEAQRFGHMLFHARIHLREGPDGTRDRAGRDLLARRDKARPRPLEFRVEPGKLHAEGRRLGMDAVAATDRGRHLVLEGPLLQRCQDPVDVGNENVARTLELDGKAGIQHVRRRHALVDEACIIPDEFSEMREERDDVVLDLALDRVDARHVELRFATALPDRRRSRLRDHAKVCQSIGRMGLDLEPDAKTCFG